MFLSSKTHINFIILKYSFSSQAIKGILYKIIKRELNMKKFRKKILKLISTPHVNLKKNYKTYRKIIDFFNPHLEPIYSTLDFKIFSEKREIPVRLFVPEEITLSDIIIFLHGGGWVTGSIDSYSNLCSNMAKMTGQRVISVDYRLAPEHPFPAGFNDAYKVVKEIFANAAVLQANPKRITLVGDSAGGNLVAAISLKARDTGDFKVPKQILIYPATYFEHDENSPFPSVIENGEDYVMTSQRIQDYMDLYVPEEKDRLNPYVAPYLAKDLKSQPDTLIITAEFDPLRDEGEAYGKRLRDDGNKVIIHRVENEIHGFFNNPLRKDIVDELYILINDFIK